MNEKQSSSYERDMGNNFFRASTKEFKKIPGSPIAYWMSATFRNAFIKGESLQSVAGPRKGLATTDNSRFIRVWSEINFSDIQVNSKCRSSAMHSGKKWFPLNKGGNFRKWYGNKDFVINWKNDGEEIKAAVISAYGGGSYTKEIRSEDRYFSDGITWNALTSSISSFRLTDYGAIFDSAGSTMFPKDRTDCLLGMLNSRVTRESLYAINPTLNFGAGSVGGIPVIFPNNDSIKKNTKQLINFSVLDWNSYEQSWDFAGNPLLPPNHRQVKLNACYQSLRAHWRSVSLEMQRLEEENNRIFIDAYGLQDELSPDVPLKEITLTCNPHYRYGGDKTEEELEALLLADTMREFISYAVGCMFGRYSLDKPGLILANQGDTLADYLAQVPEPTYMPVEDNVIPMLNGDWFADDITERFRRFLRVTFGEEHYEENLRFLENALNVKGKRSYSLRDYFLSEFYTDHLKRYKKRPIYWLFSSPKGSFNALIYMHRYRPDTVSVVLNDYLREFRAKLLARKNHLEALGISASTSQGEKTKALKEIEKISKIIAEVDAYERDTLYPLATQQLEIDLDDGVKANYPKFGAALKKIPGLEAKDD